MKDGLPLGNGKLVEKGQRRINVAGIMVSLASPSDDRADGIVLSSGVAGGIAGCVVSRFSRRLLQAHATGQNSYSTSR